MRSRLVPLLYAGVMIAAFAPLARAGQCMLMNPSFEIAGTSPNVFAGWNQSNVVGSSTAASHGKVAALVSGPNNGTWDISSYWQALDCAAGNTWKVAGKVRVPSTRPLAGTSAAIVNIEWRNASGTMISYESHTVANASSPRDSSIRFQFTSGAAPAGTATARLLLAVLQGPTDLQRDAIYDEVTFEKQTTPSIYAQQWGDFNGGREITFAGRKWRVKGTGYYSPGPSYYSDSPSMIWVDATGSLHLTITHSGSNWYSTETALEDTLGYGDYRFTTHGALDTLDPADVLGLFIWEYGPCYDTSYLWWNPYNEIDIEMSRWGVVNGPNAQFVAQPYDWGGNRHQYSPTYTAGEVTTHAFRWTATQVQFRSWAGGPWDEATSTQLQSWTYTGPHIPRPGRERVHLNLWQYGGPPASNQEVVFDDFRWVPADPALLDVPLPPASPAPPALALALRGANPAGAGTVLRCALPRAGTMRLTIHDLAGRRVRHLADGAMGEGAHDVAWDGRDDAGARVAPGVYLARLEADGRSAAVRVVVLR